MLAASKYVLREANCGGEGAGSTNERSHAWGHRTELYGANGDEEAGAAYGLVCVNDADYEFAGVG